MDRAVRGRGRAAGDGRDPQGRAAVRYCPRARGLRTPDSLVGSARGGWGRGRDRVRRLPLRASGCGGPRRGVVLDLRRVRVDGAASSPADLVVRLLRASRHTAELDPSRVDGRGRARRDGIVGTGARGIRRRPRAAAARWRALRVPAGARNLVGIPLTHVAAARAEPAPSGRGVIDGRDREPSAAVAWGNWLVDKVSGYLGAKTSRRGFLVRSALAGSAISVAG